MDYSKQIEVARDLIARFGGIGALVLDQGVALDPEQDWLRTAAPATEYPCPVVVIEYQGATAYVAMGGDIPAGVEPTDEMRIRDIGGAWWSIVGNPEIINPGGNQPIIAVCEVARWPA